ncbi:Zn peptidase [Prochlorococcus sp. MIT 1341]|uniref:Zn peptidase n=1 Tax=Prochlorococcus sp. MIT 1341 TaxID=3096221 RepID=UPI002A75409F|nr:Zn peptidase [Prochlorococcus sp. MIT 1341]
MMKALLLLLSVINSVSSLRAEELNIMAHKTCQARKGNDYKNCYLYYSRIYPERNQKGSSLIDSNQHLLAKLYDYGEPSADIADKEFLSLHFKMMYSYWIERSKARGATFPIPILRLDDGYLMGCGKKLISKLPNIYCPSSSEITVDVRPLIQGFTDRKNLNLSYLSLAILSHEFGHHVNYHIGREKYLDNEENEADWRAGKYLAYAISKKLMPLEGFTKGANLFFSVGDFHLLSKHDNPKNRFNSFMNGFNDESMGVGSFAGEWLQDTNETFSKRVGRSYKIKDRKLYFDVYRFEIERGRQIAGNIFAGVIGAINCSQGASEDCVNSLFLQGQAKPEGWFRKRKLTLNCTSKMFDIKGDGFKAQSIYSDRKGQAQNLAKRYC